MAEDRKIFPVEKVLELVVGKKDANVQSLVNFITGRATVCPTCARAAAPFAVAWLVRWYPRFMDLDWKEGDNWDGFVNQAKQTIGDNISLVPMSGRMKTLATQVMETIAETQGALERQTQASIKLEQEIKELKPLEAQLQAAQKKADDLEGRIKTMKMEMGALTRKNMEFEGKVAIDQDELMRTIKDAIKDGLKGLAVGSAVATAGDAGESQAETPAEQEVPDDFGFGNSGPDSDGFGF